MAAPHALDALLANRQPRGIGQALSVVWETQKHAKYIHVVLVTFCGQRVERQGVPLKIDCRTTVSSTTRACRVEAPSLVWQPLLQRDEKARSANRRLQAEAIWSVQHT